MNNNFTLEHPFTLLLILLFILASKYLKPKNQSYYIPNFVGFLPSNNKNERLKSTLKWVTIIFSIIALSSPTSTKQIIDENAHGMDIVLSVDTSGSMSLTGFNELNYGQNRLEAVKDVVKDFISERQNDRIALVVFGDTSGVASPLSYDNEAPLNVIKQISIGVVGKSTALIDSLVTSTELLKNSLSTTKLIILLSDGDDTASKVPLEIALKLAKKHHVKIYTISIGESNNNMLKIISEESNAKSFVATNKKDLSRVYESITELEFETHNLDKTKIIEYLYVYFLYASLASALLLAFLVRNGENF